MLMSIYNKEKPEFFSKAIESILNQTVLPAEVIIIKDGKLNPPLDNVIDKYMLMYPKLFRVLQLQINKGLGKALQVGVEHSSFDIIARMDTDDIAREDRFEKQLEVLEAHPEVDIVGSFISEFDGEISDVLSIRKVPILNDEIYNGAKRRNPFNHMTVMYRKEAVLKAGNYQPFLWNEDYYLWVRMIVNGSKMCNIPECLVYARTGDNMFERRGGLRYLSTEIRLQTQFLKHGLIGYGDFVTNIVLRGFVRIIPNKLRRYIYMRFLRN